MGNDLTINNQSNLEKSNVPAIPEELTAQSIIAHIQRDDLPWYKKWQLINLEAQAACEARKSQVDGMLKVQREKIRIQSDIVIRALRKYEEDQSLLIRKEHTETIATLGREVEIETLESIRTFSKELTGFKKQLQADGDDIEPFMKEHIEGLVRESFFRICTKLQSLTGKLLVAVGYEK